LGSGPVEETRAGGDLARHRDRKPFHDEVARAVVVAQQRIPTRRIDADGGEVHVVVAEQIAFAAELQRSVGMDLYPLHVIEKPPQRVGRIVWWQHRFPYWRTGTVRRPVKEVLTRGRTDGSRAVIRLLSGTARLRRRLAADAAGTPETHEQDRDAQEPGR
jgi:hypothetical protein